MVPYTDSKGVIWSIDPPGTSLTTPGDDGKPVPYKSENWTARITSAAYGHPADTTLAISTDGRDIRDAIESYVTSPLQAVPVKRQDAPAATGGGGWVILLLIAWGIREHDKRKRRS